MKAKPFAAAVVERAQAQRAKGKTVRLPPAADMPPVEIIGLDGTRRLGDREMQFSMQRADRGIAWLKVIAALHDLAGDADVSANPTAAEFVRLMREVAGNGPIADDVIEVLRALGAKFVAGGRAKGTVSRVRKAVRDILKHDPKATAAQAWELLKAAAPKGITVHENRAGRYIETAGAADTSYRRFANILSEEKRRPKRPK